MMNPLEDQFRSRALYDGAMFILSKEDAVAFVQACRSAGMALRRIDGFELLPGGRILPRPEHSFDYATPEARAMFANPAQAYVHALAFLSIRGDGMGFEITTNN